MPYNPFEQYSNTPLPFIDTEDEKSKQQVDLFKTQNMISNLQNMQGADQIMGDVPMTGQNSMPEMGTKSMPKIDGSGGGMGAGAGLAAFKGLWNGGFNIARLAANEDLDKESGIAAFFSGLMSDERAKTNITPASPQSATSRLQNMLQRLDALEGRAPHKSSINGPYEDLLKAIKLKGGK